MNLPDTRNSLLVRLGNPADADAWNEFSQVYRPIIVRMGRSRGLQTADAEDLAQRVLVSIAGAIDRWEPEGKAKFRTWLKRITDNAILNALTRTKPDQAAGSTSVVDLLNNSPGSEGVDSKLLELEYRREVLHWAARRIRDEFTETTWQAFWLTTIEAKPAEAVGQALGRNRGSIYAAKSRVMRRLLQQIDQFEAGEITDHE
jgi:RNA polymerase sigma-70 factor (ECF subfamily)